MHHLSPCYRLLTALVLLNSVTKWCNTTQFFTKMVSLYMLCAWASEGRPKVVKFVFYHSIKNSVFCWNFQIPAPLPTPICLCVGKRSCHTIKKLGNFKRFTIISNSEILLNLIRKMKYLTDQFQLCFCFCIGNAKYLYFISAFATQFLSLQTTC